MRVDGYGRIDRGREIRFSFDGKGFRGHPGDTLASALLANGVTLMGRSFKYHRPRGPLTAGPEEPNALVEIGTGASRTPNTRATVQEIHEGLVATSQNRLGPLDMDLMAVNDLLHPFLGAGFYYKTFMWPRAFWEKLYEPVIRRAAGLGRLSGEHDTGRYEKAFAFCDLLVIGAGPAGLMAALTAARGGLDVILADETAEPGGRLLSESEKIDGAPASDWVAATLVELRDAGVRIMPRTTVTGAYDGGVYGALERVGLHLPEAPDMPRECFWRITAQRAILAAGALERPIAFPMNDRPGIMMASAVRTYLHRYGVAPGQKVALFATNDDAHRTATDLIAAGIDVAAVVDPREDVTTAGEYRLIRGEIVDTAGRRALREITVRANGGETRIEADCLAVSGGWNPNVHLTCHLGARPVWNDRLEAFLPAKGAVPGLIPAGAAAGQYTTAACLSSGRDAAIDALSQLGRKAPKLAIPVADDRAGTSRALWQVTGHGRAWLDFANDVTTKDVKLAAAENYASVEHMKRYTTQGMAPDQGKNSNISALAVLADATGRTIAETGTTTYRPPFTPVSLGAIGAGARGKGFAPERLTTSHDASLDRGAPIVATGLWYRPSYFPRSGETTWREACDREVGMVRTCVGVADVSTLGKIDIQGKDAAAFLDFVYTNTFSTLKPGRVRYGLMLREDGHVMDDGTTACLAENHYLMTTTTAAAGQVMAHLDFVSQCLRPDLDVRFISVTEQWAQFAVAGPQAAALIGTVLDDAPELPFMGCAAVSVMGVPGRLFRISFSGEEGYEIAVPARYGAGLFRDLVGRAETMGGGAYGMEALNVLRIEKGFITHAEIDGRVTAGDLGMGKMVSAKKDCIGKTASERPGLADPARPALVGLRPANGNDPIPAGAHLYDEGDAPTRVNKKGHVTSTCYSATLKTHMALAFLVNGHDRLGERVRVKDHLRGADLICEITDPVVFDPDGGRMRG
ncbi:sarcosine oxidase subunit alpha family protein [Rhodobacterales bacterium HKCCE3408]|nr:sarcosine oxidase subunit alpha family protein [Rhodobacterales bacterium HKCCE3408]